MKQERILHYHAVFEPAEEGGYNVSFPSLPGCVTFGKNFEDAKEKGREVLELWLEELQEQGERIPIYNEYPIISEIQARISVKA